MSNFSNYQWLCERAILVPRNDDINNINWRIQNSYPGMITTYKSIDSVSDQEQAVHYPTEFLNSIELPGFPPHELCLKKASVIILLRNLYPPQPFNGTRLVI